MKRMKNLARKTRVAVAIIGLAGASLIFMSFGSRNFELARNLDIFNSLFRELVIHYVDDINPSELIKTGIDEMLYNLDPYTNFIPESQIEDMRFMTTGQYGGIGALIMSRDEYTVISEPYEGFPAHKAGLLAGDKILEINGQDVTGMPTEDIRQILQGQPGTSLTITVERPGERTPITKSLERKVVQIDNIPYYGMIDETTGYIRLNGFTQTASREVREAYNDLKNNHDLQHIILDLRGNGGGLMNEAVNITNFFIPKDKLVVSTKGRLAERGSTHRTLNNPIDTEIPLVVLVDRGSASASEIVAGAIQDYDRGVVLGQRTFGKGLVQNVVNLSYNTQLKVTVAKYYIPSGRLIQAIDYAQRNEDGSVAAIPDSLKQAFTTSKGRTVYDGGGIEPDVKTERPTPSHITRALFSQLLVFDFANDFYRRNPSIPGPETFTITDDIYREFVAFVNDRDFEYTTASEQMLQRLRNVSREEKYYDAIQDELEQLRLRIISNKEEDLMTFRPEIEHLLRDEIVTRYYHQRGRVLSRLTDDPDVNAAIQLFANKDQYRGILAGPNNR
jgi:carboxyl-terminal processing protease